MRRRNRLVAVILVGLLLINMNTLAATDSNTMADYLNALGILKGTEAGYELDKDLSRVQGAVMIVRLRGAELEALEADYSHPFTDVPVWASPYVGYMYHYGLTSGKSTTVFGTDDLITIEQYVTFLLRTLGYDDKAGDFVWSDSLAKAADIGMITANRNSGTSNFTRGQMVALTYDTLQTKMKSASTTLLQQLTAKDALPPTIDIADMFLAFEAYVVKSRPATYNSLLKSVQKLAFDLEASHTFDVSQISDLDLDQLTDDVNEGVAQIPMYSSIIKGYEIHRLGSQLTITINYNVTRSEHDSAIAEAKRIVRTVIDSTMTDYEKELAIHDYIVDTVVYDETPNPVAHVYTMYGALVNKSAVCHGYAESFRYLGYLAGLDVDLVIGDASYNGTTIGHAWNMITLDGQSYHVDTTWDDPVGGSDSNNKSYAYFNVTDEIMAKDHQWIESNYSTCNATTYNYFNYESLQVYGLDGLQSYLQDGFYEGKTTMNIRVVGVDMTMDLLRSVLSECDRPYNVTFKVNAVTNVVTVNKDE